MRIFLRFSDNVKIKHETGGAIRFHISSTKLVFKRDIMKIATWNIRDLGQKETELTHAVEQQRVNTAIISETKKKLKGTREQADRSGMNQHIK